MSSTKATENGSSNNSQDPNPPTRASFSPTQAVSGSRKQNAVLVHEKSPLLVATPPQITRALAFSHPFILPLNKLLGLLSWSSGDPWESFLVVAIFWAIVLYGDVITKWAGPVVLVAALVVGMYSRRYSPLSTKATSDEPVKKRQRGASEGSFRHQKSLDDIVDTMNMFTSRCNILLDPLFQFTEFLSTQRTPTSSTTKPALTTLFLRILMVLPLWVGLTFPPVQIITTRRVVMAIGTLGLTWHSRPARVSRTILWRSRAIRRVTSIITGLSFTGGSLSSEQAPALPPRRKSQQAAAKSIVNSGRGSSAGVRFTFTVYENQRRWLGLGWTSSMFAYERASWTDEHLNPSPSKENFGLPVVEGADAKWQWVPGSEWKTEGAGKASSSTSKTKNEGWIFYDNKWNDGRRQDGWGRYTRRRKWYRDAELVDDSPNTKDDPTELPANEAKSLSHSSTPSKSQSSGASNRSAEAKDEVEAGNSTPKRRGFFRRGSTSRASVQSSNYSSRTVLSSDDEADVRSPHDRPERDIDWSVGDELKMGLG